MTFTATVTGFGATPTGAIQWRIDAVNFGSPIALNGSGQAQLALSTLSAGSHTIEAIYSGSLAYLGSTGALSGGQSIDPATPVVTPTDESRTYGDPVGSYGFGVTGFVNGEDASTAAGYTAPVCSSAYSPTTPVSASPLTITCVRRLG